MSKLFEIRWELLPALCKSTVRDPKILEIVLAWFTSSEASCESWTEKVFLIGQSNSNSNSNF